MPESKINVEHVKKSIDPELPISEAKFLPQDPMQDHVRGGVKTQLPLAALLSVFFQYNCVPECKVVFYPVIPSKQGG